MSLIYTEPDEASGELFHGDGSATETLKSERGAYVRWYEAVAAAISARDSSKLSIQARRICFADVR